MRFRFIPLYPFFQDFGGARRHAEEIVNEIKRRGFFIESLDWSAKDIDFDVLIVFGFFIHNPDILEFCHSKGVKIILIPLFDPMYNFFSYSLLYNVGKIFPLQNTAKIRKRILEVSDIIMANNSKEKSDLIKIFGVKSEKIFVNYVGLSTLFKEKSKLIDEDLFFNKYKIKDFVFYPSAAISKRKNQIGLLKAVYKTQIPLVITGTRSIEKDIKKDFDKLTVGQKNILCIDWLGFDELISAYKCAKVMVSVSNAETAGLVNLEAGYLGCNLVLDFNPVFKEYIGDMAIYVSRKSPESIRNGILKALNMPKNNIVSQYIENKFSWERYIDRMFNLLKN
ncbi:MAG: glycosyltransferase [Brevinematia bacterium]